MRRNQIPKNAQEAYEMHLLKQQENGEIGNDADPSTKLFEDTTLGRQQRLNTQWDSASTILKRMASRGRWGAAVVYEVLNEFLGTTFFSWAVCLSLFVYNFTVGGTINDEEQNSGSLTVTTIFGGPINLFDSPDTDTLTRVGAVSFDVAFMQGAAIYLAMMFFGHWSADFSPVFSLFDGLLPKSTYDDDAVNESEGTIIGRGFMAGLLKAGAAHVGYIVGSAIALAMVGSALFPPTPVPMVGNGFAFLIEAVGAMWLAWMRCHVIYDPRSASSDPIAVGVLRTLLVLIGITLTGGVYNWGIYFGIAIFSGFASTWWIYLLADASGVAAGIALWFWITRSETE